MEQQEFAGLHQPGPQTGVLAKALIQQAHLIVWHGPVGSSHHASATIWPILKSSEKASFMLNYIFVNGEIRAVWSFWAPTVEVLAVETQIVCGGHHVLPSGLEEHRDVLHSMHRQVHGTNKEICITHGDTGSSFSNLPLLE